MLVKNQDTTPEEFESHTLHREKVIPGGAERTIFIGPLEPGTYEFFDEFNPKTAKGRVIVFREVLEATLVIGLVLAVTGSVAGRTRFVALGLIGGLAVVVMLTWHLVWMKNIPSPWVSRCWPMLRRLSWYLC